MTKLIKLKEAAARACTTVTPTGHHSAQSVEVNMALNMSTHTDARWTVLHGRAAGGSTDGSESRWARCLGAADAAVCAGGAASGRVAARGALVVLSLVLAAPH